MNKGERGRNSLNPVDLFGNLQSGKKGKGERRRIRSCLHDRDSGREARACRDSKRILLSPFLR